MALKAVDDGLLCQSCQTTYSVQNGVADLIIGERFEDEFCECMWSNEEDTGRHLARNYIAPLLRRLTFSDNGSHANQERKLRVLSIGCGVGTDVEQLSEEGFDAYGVDAGNRSDYWQRRLEPDRFLLANGKNLPFANETFDAVIMGCVLPHIGVVGDSCDVNETYQNERRQASREMLRVVRAGGVLVLSSPNRLCPVDFFHRPRIGSHMPRIHSVRERFLLSANDYAELLSQDGVTRKPEVLPIGNYWGFYSSSRYLLGRILQAPVKIYFKLLSSPLFSFARASGLNPWLILCFRK